MWFKSSFTIPAVAAISFCLIGPTFPAAADILHVPGDFLTIQEAIDAAMDGDEVEVHPGTYNENIDLLGKAITVRSSDGAGVTTIHAGYNGTVVTCASGEGPDTILDGFTITGGSANWGGGMYNENSSPTITNCTFKRNSAVYYGGGMYNDNSSPTVSNCTFIENSAATADEYDALGGGMYNVFSSPTVTNCAFIGNSSTFRGGGMYSIPNSNGVVTNCTFIGNIAGSQGGGMYEDNGSSSTVTNCTFIGNIAGNHGGGMVSSTSSPTVTNCTFSGNTAGNDGGGIRSVFGSNMTVANCIVWQNTPNSVSGGNEVTVTYSDVEGHFPGDGNIDADPLFVDPDSGDFRLSAGSPAIDAADNTAVPKGTETDLDGNPRFVDDLGTPNTGNADCVNPIVDMGAYEFLPFPSPPGDLNGDGVVGITDLLILLASWGDCPALPEQCAADLNYDCVVGIDDLLTLLANWG